MFKREYSFIKFDVTNALSVVTEALADKNDYHLGSLIRAVADIARTAGVYADAIEYDRKDLALARKNPDVFADWLSSSLSQLAYDLFELGGKDNLAEAETSLREALALSLKAFPDAAYKSIAIAEIGGLYQQLVHALLAQSDKDKTHAEIVNLIAFFDKTLSDGDEVDVLVNSLGDSYDVLLQLAEQYRADGNDDDYAKAVSVAKEAVVLLPKILDAQPSFAPKSLDYWLGTLRGAKPVYTMPPDVDAAAPDKPATPVASAK